MATTSSHTGYVNVKSDEPEDEAPIYINQKVLVWFRDTLDDRDGEALRDALKEAVSDSGTEGGKKKLSIEDAYRVVVKIMDIEGFKISQFMKILCVQDEKELVSVGHLMGTIRRKVAPVEERREAICGSPDSTPSNLAKEPARIDLPHSFGFDAYGNETAFKNYGNRTPNKGSVGIEMPDSFGIDQYGNESGPMGKWLYEKTANIDFSPEANKGYLPGVTMSEAAVPCPAGPAGVQAPPCQENGHGSTEDGQDSSEDTQRTTVMLKNIPNDYKRGTLLELLDSKGFKGKYDFMYLPTDFNRFAGLGYAFVNMLTHQDALDMVKEFTGFEDWKVASRKVCSVAWANKEQQGLSQNLERFRNSPVMHESVPAEHKPLYLENGVEQAFLAPTKRIRAPRVKVKRGPGEQGQDDYED